MMQTFSDHLNKIRRWTNYLSTSLPKKDKNKTKQYKNIKHTHKKTLNRTERQSFTALKTFYKSTCVISIIAPHWGLNVQEEDLKIPDLLKITLLYHSRYWVFKGSLFRNKVNPFSKFRCFCVLPIVLQNILAAIMKPVSINPKCALLTPCGRSVYH